MINKNLHFKTINICHESPLSGVPLGKSYVRRGRGGPRFLTCPYMGVGGVKNHQNRPYVINERPLGCCGGKSRRSVPLKIQTLTSAHPYTLLMLNETQNKLVSAFVHPLTSLQTNKTGCIDSISLDVTGLRMKVTSQQRWMSLWLQGGIALLRLG